jgi:hypothetical protein
VATLIDPRRLAAIEVQLDALVHEARAADDSELNAAPEGVRKALKKSDGILRERSLYIQVPSDYKPPKGLGGCSGLKSSA